MINRLVGVLVLTLVLVIAMAMVYANTNKAHAASIVFSLVKATKAVTDAPKKKVAVLTLDDEWIGQYQYGLPILKKNGFNATWFVTCRGPIELHPDFVRGKSNEITSWNELKQIHADGFDLQNHGMTHHSLVDQPASILEQEIVDSKRCFEQNLGFTPTIFAPASAKPENNATIDGLMDKTGYEFARNGYCAAGFDNGRFDLTTMSMNDLDRKFEHNPIAILPQFASEVAKAELPVLVYHNINNLNATESNWQNSTTTPETFAAEMKWLKQNGYEVHSIRDLTWDANEEVFRFK